MEYRNAVNTESMFVWVPQYTHQITLIYEMLWGGSDAEKKFLREMNKCIQ
jgi:hypothetical protein